MNAKEDDDDFYTIDDDGRRRLGTVGELKAEPNALEVS